MTPITVLGAGGFIGHNLVRHLQHAGCECRAVTRLDLPGLFAAGGSCGHIIDCIGLTANFRARPLETADAHFGLVAHFLNELEFDSFLYLSSTRVYARNDFTREDVTLEIYPAEPNDLYNITKLAGEAICLSDPRPTVRVARLSNVYGADMGSTNFLGRILADGAATGRIALSQSLLSAKDYIAVEDAVPALLSIATAAQNRIYNVATGVNTSHDSIATSLARRLGWHISAPEDAPTLRFPRIDITRLRAEFPAPRRRILDDLEPLAAHFRAALEAAC